MNYYNVSSDHKTLNVHCEDEAMAIIIAEDILKEPVSQRIIQYHQKSSWLSQFGTETRRGYKDFSPNRNFSIHEGTFMGWLCKAPFHAYYTREEKINRCLQRN